MLKEIHELYAYNRWANERIRSAAGVLSEEELTRDLGSSFPSIIATLAHILSAEWIWLERWNGRSPAGTPEGWNLAGFPEMRERWSEVEQAQRAFVEGLVPDHLQKAIRYRTTRGEAFEAPLWQLMRHVVNHSTYHRGQVVTMLRQLGRSAPGTDLVLYYREQTAALPGDAGSSARRS